MKISKIAEILSGRVENLRLDKEIKGLKSVESANEDHITFLKDKRYLDKIKAGAVIVGSYIPELDIPQIIVDKPEVAFYKLIDIFYIEEKKESKISSLAVIDENVEIGENCQINEYVVIKRNVKIGKNCVIYPFCYIGENTIIGDNCILYPNVVIYKDTVLGNNVIIHANCVIAGDGFGYYMEDGKHKKIRHVGKVIIEDEVEIGANTTIDRAMLDETVIRKGTKIDNLVMVGHNCKIGQNTILVSQVGIAGSSKIGNNVILAGQVGVADHITIGDNVIVTAKSGVGSDLPPNGIYGSSIHAIEWKKWKRVMALLPKLPEIIKKLKIE